MKLTILKDNNYKRAFIEYVKEYTKKVFFRRIKPTRLVVITKYFNDNIKGKRKIDAFNLVI